MNTSHLWWSSVGKKLLNGATGLALIGFICVHLAGNLTLFARDGGRLFNSYAHHLESLGPLLCAMEMGLIALFALHAASAISVRLSQKEARPQAYAVSASKGGPSKQTLSSRSMLITGLLLAGFVVLHVKMFKYGPHYVTTLKDGTVVRDLYKLVVEEFAKPAVTWSYVAIMLMLGLHLRHGFWSALQSLGALKPKCSCCVYAAGLVFAVLLAGGFLLLPLYFLYCPAAATGGVP